MIQLDQPASAVRRSLRLLRRPHLLERDELGLRLRRALQVPTCRDALLLLIDRTFAIDQRSREIVARCDVEGQKARAAAAGMHLSLRQFFRLRAAAIQALALSLEHLDEVGSLSANPSPVYCARCGTCIAAERAVDA